MKLTAKDLLDLKVIDKIIEEPIEGAHKDISFVCKSIKEYLLEELSSLMKLNIEDLLDNRFKKLRAMGVWELF